VTTGRVASFAQEGGMMNIAVLGIDLGKNSFMWTAADRTSDLSVE
jgi:hypothetical protein